MRTAVIFIILFMFLRCDKAPTGPATILQVQVEGVDTEQSWEFISGSWTPGPGEIEMAAEGYQLQRFKLRYGQIKNSDTLKFSSIEEIYFSDGPDFIPDTAFGNLIITHVTANSVGGQFEVRLVDHSLNNSKKLKGSFIQLNSQ
jgi:hypothetical protein